MMQLMAFRGLCELAVKSPIRPVVMKRREIQQCLIGPFTGEVARARLKYGKETVETWGVVLHLIVRTDDMKVLYIPSLCELRGSRFWWSDRRTSTAPCTIPV